MDISSNDTCNPSLAVTRLRDASAKIQADWIHHTVALSRWPSQGHVSTIQDQAPIQKHYYIEANTFFVTTCPVAFSFLAARAVPAVTIKSRQVSCESQGPPTPVHVVSLQQRDHGMVASRNNFCSDGSRP
jgi:hypothetical protein